MFHASRALTAVNAARYFEAEYRQGDYYTRGNSTAPGRWFGRAAADLGLHGDIRPDDFTALLEGRAPDGTLLVQAQQATGRRRAGWGFACSADKSVSIAALVFEDGRLLDAHDSAVRRALTELETFVQTRAKAGTEVQTTGRMAAALFRHESSRALNPRARPVPRAALRHSRLPGRDGAGHPAARLPFRSALERGGSRGARWPVPRCHR